MSSEPEHIDLFESLDEVNKKRELENIKIEKKRNERIEKEKKENIISIEEIQEIEDSNGAYHLGRYELYYFRCFEENRDKAYTFQGFILEFINKDNYWSFIRGQQYFSYNLLNYDFIEEMLKKMVLEGKIKGVYDKITKKYYFHF